MKTSVWCASTAACYTHRLVINRTAKTWEDLNRGGSGVSRGGVGFNSHTPKFRRPSKIIPNSTRLWKLLKIAEFRKPAYQDVWKKGSKILKLPSVRNCFTLAMTNKLVVIINSLKVPKIKNIKLYEMKFLVPNYSCLPNPWLGGYRPQIPVLSVLWPELNLMKPPRNKIPGYAAAFWVPSLAATQKFVNPCQNTQRPILRHSNLHNNQCQELTSCTGYPIFY